MSMNDYDLAVRLMNVYPNKMGFSGPKTESVIKEAEEKLGLIFPPVYRRFLQDLGAGTFNNLKVFGLMNKRDASKQYCRFYKTAPANPAAKAINVIDVVAITQWARKKGLYKNLIVIGRNNGVFDCIFIAEDLSNGPIIRTGLRQWGKASLRRFAENEKEDFGAHLLNWVSVHTALIEGGLCPLHLKGIRKYAASLIKKREKTFSRKPRQKKGEPC